jgi:DNA-binding transcriptional LysR family regulator
VSNSFAVRQATLAGAGIAMLGNELVADDLKSNRLVAVLPTYSTPSRLRHLVWLQNRRMPLKLRVFIDYMTELYARRTDHTEDKQAAPASR